MPHAGPVSGWISARLGAPESGTVVHVEGRSLRKNGLPLVSSLSLRTGEDVATWTLGPQGDDPWVYEPILTIPRRDFDACPICGVGSVLSKEHVPPERLGGKAHTTTCERCNHVFGTFEDALLRRAEERYTLAVRGPAIRGEQRVSDVVIRQDARRNWMLTKWNGDWPSWIEEIFRGESHEFQLEAPCHCKAYASMLKSAYLAACTFIPDAASDGKAWPVARMVRNQLLRWRDAPAKHLTISRTFNHLHERYDAPRVTDPAVTLCRATNSVTGDVRTVIRMGWRLVIDWPIDAVRLQQRSR